MKLYMQVSRDELELPLVVAETISELARKCGVTRDNVNQQLYRSRKQKTKKSQYVCVEIPDDEESESDNGYQEAICKP